MKVWQFGEIRKKIELDLDLQFETNITPDEMVGYANEAIADAAAEILKINEDYFLKSTTLAMVQGTSTYAMPSDCYAAKIRDLIYANSNVIYKVKRLRGERKFLDKTLTDQYGTALDYRYLIQNVSAAVGYQIALVPAARETGSFLTAWYIRTANYVPLVTGGSQAASDATLVDIPEFYSFIIQYMKVRCLEKDGADPRLPQTLSILDHERTMMVDTLTQMVPDDDDYVVPDYTHYWEHE